MKESLFWWLQYLRIFALNSPWGSAVKLTIRVHAYEGEAVARMWKTTPSDFLDRYGRPCKSIETNDKTIAIEWVIETRSDYGGPTTSWGTMPQ